MGNVEHSNSHVDDRQCGANLVAPHLPAGSVG